MTKLKIGIIGTGSVVVGGHAPAIASADNLELTSVLSRTNTRGREFFSQFSSSTCNIHNDIDCFAHDNAIDLAIICPPDGLHYNYAQKCLEAGKHILLEKPMALTVSDCEHLIDLANDKNLVLGTGFHLRHHAGHRILVDQITNSQLIGEIRHIRAIWAWPQTDDSNWRAREGLARWWSLSAVGTHCFDMTRWVAQDFDEWASLQSVTSNSIWGGPHDETAVVSGQLSSKVTVEIVSSVQFGPYNRFEIFGSQGHAICEGTFGRTGEGEIRVNGDKMEFTPINPFFAQLQNIFDSIKNNKTPIGDGNTGLINVRDLSLVEGCQTMGPLTKDSYDWS